MKVFTKIFWSLLWDWAISLAFCILTSSCVTQKACNAKFPPITKDSIVEKTTIVYKDTTIHVAGETVHDTIPYQIDCDKNGHGTLRPINRKKEGKDLTTSVKTGGDNSLIVSADCHDKDITIQKQKEIIEKLRKETSATVLPPEKYIPWWIWAIIGLSAGLNLIGFILYSIHKFVHSI